MGWGVDMQLLTMVAISLAEIIFREEDEIFFPLREVREGVRFLRVHVDDVAGAEFEEDGFTG